MKYIKTTFCRNTAVRYLSWISIVIFASPSFLWRTHLKGNDMYSLAHRLLLDAQKTCVKSIIDFYVIDQCIII